MTVPFLILDELGSEPRSAQWSDVDDVVFARYEADLTTWVTTWMAHDQMAAKYGDGFARRIFERVVLIDCGTE
jgi:DNA replication protein DnaC